MPSTKDIKKEKQSRKTWRFGIIERTASKKRWSNSRCQTENQEHEL